MLLFTVTVYHLVESIVYKRIIAIFPLGSRNIIIENIEGFFRIATATRNADNNIKMIIKI